jgi:methylamine dehydrogenase accessory protein MauD
VGTLLPLTELAIAIALVVGATARFGAVGALALLGAFIVVIARSMARGEQPDCHCFGQLHSGPVGTATLIRTAAFASLAGFVVVGGWSDPGSSATRWLATLSSRELLVLVAGSVILILFGLLGLFSWQLLRQNGRLLLRLEAVEGAVGLGSADAPQGLVLGSEAPAFTLANLHGARIALADLVARGRLVLLIFSDPACGPCTALLPEIGRWQREHAELLTVALVSRGTVEQNRVGTSGHSVDDLLLQADREVAEAYNAGGTPTAVLVDTDGRIASDAALGVVRVKALVNETIALAHAAVNGSGHAAFRSLEITASSR